MPLLVVPLGAEDTDRLTLGELDALRRCERVLFEVPDHPLAARLSSEGVDAGAFDDELDPAKEGWALVADPASARIVELARGGASVSAGVADPPDDLTAAYGAYLARRGARALTTLAAVMARLRGPDGCPWDAEQTHASLQVHLVEETYEVLEAIDAGDTGAELEEELGDLLLQVAFHAQLAADEGRFDLAGVAEGIVAKLIRRHPHVFAGTAVADAAEVVRNWETIKAEEKERSDPFDDVPEELPALLSAYKKQKRAASLGWAAGEAEALDGARRALDDREGLGDALFWLVAVARARGLDPEAALRRATLKFQRSF